MTPFFGKTSYKTTAINFLLNSVYGKVFPISNKTLLNLIPFNTGMENALFYTRCNCLNVDDKGKLMINTNISNINQSVLQASSSQSVKNTPYSSSSARPNESPSSIVTISPQAQLASIGSRYDVTNMSEKEMGEMSHSLFDSGLIGSLEFAVMSFPLDKMREDIGIDVNPSEKLNFLEQYKNSLVMARQNNASPQEINTWENIVDTLDKLS